jgi:hypothetical protein
MASQYGSEDPGNGFLLMPIAFWLHRKGIGAATLSDPEQFASVLASESRGTVKIIKEALSNRLAVSLSWWQDLFGDRSFYESISNLFESSDGRGTLEQYCKQVGHTNLM